MSAIREAWWYVRHGRRALRQAESNWQTVLLVNRQLSDLIGRHHALGALEGVNVGDTCPVCAKAGVQIDTLIRHDLVKEIHF